MTFVLTAHSGISSSLGKACRVIPPIASWIRVQTVRPKFFHSWPLATTQALISYIAWVQNISSDCFACLSECTCQHLWQSATTDLGITTLFNKFRWNAFTQRKCGAYFVCCDATVAPYQLVNPADVSRHNCSVRTITLSFVVKFCSSCFSSF